MTAPERPESWWSEFFLSPQVFGALAFLFGVAAATFGWISARPAREPEWAVPASWVRLTTDTPDGDRALFPEALVDAFRSGQVAAAAVERPLGKFQTDGQTFAAVVFDGPLRLDLAERLAAIVRQMPPVAAVPDEQIIKTDVQTLHVRGTAIVSAHVVTWDGDVFAYAVPFAKRSALLLYTCAPIQCPRIQRMSESAVRATGGVAELSPLDDGLVKLVSRFVAVFSAFAFFALTGVAVWLARAGERTGGRSARS